MLLDTAIDGIGGENFGAMLDECSRYGLSNAARTTRHQGPEAVKTKGVCHACSSEVFARP